VCVCVREREYHAPRTLTCGDTSPEYVRVCVYVCVYEREGERKREREGVGERERIGERERE